MKKSIQIIFLLIAIGFNSFAQTVDLQQGLVAYYPFNGNANDESGKGNNGTVYEASLVTDRNGKSKSAYSFDGYNDYIKIYNLKFDKKGTIALWIYFDGVQKASVQNISYGNFFGRQHNQVFSNFVLGLNNSNPDYSNIIWYPFKHKGENLKSSSKIGNREWRFIVLTFENNRHSIYIDGKIENSKNIYGNYKISNKPFTIGAWIDDGAGYLKGKMDDIRIYNRALNETEIQTLFNDKNIVASNITNKNTTNKSNVNETISEHTVVSYSNCHSAITALNSKSKLPTFENYHLTVTTKSGKPYKKVEFFIDGQNLAITNDFGRFDTTLNKNSNIKLLFKKGGKQFSKIINFSKDSIYTFKLKLHKPEYTTFSIDSKDLETPIYEKIKTANNISLFNSFVSRFPKGKYNTDIMRKIETIWYNTTINQKCTELYEKFISKYPNDKYTDKVKIAYDNNLFDLAKKENTIQSYKNYLKESPFDNYKKEVIQLAYQVAKNKNTKNAYSNFIKSFPNSIYENDAKRKEKQSEEYEYYNVTKSGTIGSCNKYLTKYPKGRYVSYVKTRKKHLLEEDGIFDNAMNGNKNDCETYLSKYRNGKYVENIKERKDFLDIKNSMKISELERFMKKYPKGEYFNYIKKQKSSIVVFTDYYHSMRTKTGDRERDFLGSAKIDFSRDFVIECKVNVKRIIKAKKPYKGYGNYYFDFGEHRVYVNKGGTTVKKNKRYVGSKDISIRTGTQMLKIEKTENSYTYYYKGSKITTFPVDFPSDNELSFAIGTVWGIELTSSVEVKYTSAPEILTEEELYNKAKNGAIVDCDKFIYIFPNSVYTQSVKERKHKLNFIKAGEFNIPEYKLHVLSDKRDGKTYIVTKIDNLWWFVDNLSYSDKNARSFDPGYGRFYNYNISDNTCPSGWRIPTIKEYEHNKKEIPTLMTGYLHHVDADGFFQARWHSFNDKGDKAIYWALDNRNKTDLWYGYYTKYPIWKDKNKKSYTWGSSKIRDNDTREKFYTIRCVSEDWTPND